MKSLTVSRARLAVLVACILIVVALSAWPFSAQQQQLPFDESRIVADLSRELRLEPEQTVKLSELLQRRRPRIDALLQQMQPLQPGSPQHAELKSQLERERRAVLDEFLPTIRPEQQIRLRGLTGNPPPQPASSISALKPNFPAGAFAANEHLIPLPAISTNENTRSRRAVPPPPLSEEQRILHLLNRSGFGPRPGDIERVKRMGVERYLDEQLHPEDMADEFLTRPLQSLNTLQSTLPELFQNFLPPPPRPVPTPTPTPLAVKKDGEMVGQGEGMKGQPQSSEKTDAKGAPSSRPQVTPSPVPTPTPVDTQRPLRELQQAKLLRAVFSERQLQEVMVDFWFNHFNIFAGKDNERFFLTIYERDVIRPNAFGKFKELLT
ncbi:MAG: DUF1800 family protein, partial [Blastocatellia bacterium]